MFLKIVFFFVILNVIMGFTVGFLNNAFIETGNPNTTIFMDRGITQNDVVAQLNGVNTTYTEFQGNVSQFEREQFTPQNETGGTITDSFSFFASFNFLNIGEMLKWLNFFNIFFVLSVADNIMTNIGIAEFPAGLLDALGVVLTFAAIVWFIFIIFGRAPSGFT